MAARNPPWATDGGGSHAAEDIRRIVGALAGGSTGVLGTADLAVTAQGTPDRSVNVAAGGVLIPATGAGLAGPYFGYNTANVVLSTSVGDAVNPRDDIVVAKYDDSTKAWSLAVVQGTPAASPVDPTLPDNSVALARLRIQQPPNDTVAAGDITNLRPPLGAWTPYTPTWGGTGVSLGNGAIVGRYRLIGRTLHLYIRLLLGGTSTVGSGVWSFTLPSGFTPVGATAYLTGAVLKSVTGLFPALGQITGGTMLVLVPASTSSTVLNFVQATIPAGSWASNDSVQIGGSFEVN